MPRKDDIQGLLTDRFQNFEAEPEMDLWQGIEAELYPEKQKSRKLWPYFSVAASIAILIFTWVYLGKSEMNQDLQPAFVEEKTVPVEKPEVENPLLSTPDEGLEKETQMAVEKTENTTKPVERIRIQNKKEVKAPVAVNESPSQPIPQPLFQKKEPLERSIAKGELEAGRIEKKETQLAVAPISKELFAAKNIKIEQPKAQEVPVNIAPDKPVSGVDDGTNALDLNNLSFKNIVSFASDGIDKIKNASPVKVYEEKNDRGESKVYQLNLFNLSVSHRTQKRRNKKVRL